MADFSPQACYQLLEKVRAEKPLVQNITNYVAMTISANVLLALGASPAMAHAGDEQEDFSAIASSLVINIGTLSPHWIEAMKSAGSLYAKAGKPWVLDPVGVGATRYRNTTAADLLALKPTVLRGNAGEVMALAGMAGGVKGVDSTAGSQAAIDIAKNLATESGIVVAVTGETDFVTDGNSVVEITGGHALMPLSTALGCSLSGVVGAFVAVAPPLEATIAALSVYAAAGKLAGDKLRGPGHLPAELCDALYGLDAATLDANSKVRQL